MPEYLVPLVITQSLTVTVDANADAVELPPLVEKEILFDPLLGVYI